MKVPFYTGVREYRRREEEFDHAIKEVLLRGDYILGTEVGQLEDEIREYTGAGHAVGVANGSDALFIALKAMGIGPGDEVITTPFTFFASVSAITRLGAVPVFTDIDRETFNMDLSRAESLITEKTRAILPVHLFSQTADMDSVLALSEKHGLKVLEDAAEAFGMRHRGRHAGTMGDAGTFSFYPTKTLGGYGDGGMIITDDNEIAETCSALRKHGETSRYHHGTVGFNSRLDTIQAAVLRLKLHDIEKDIEKRDRVRDFYDKALAGISGLQTPVTAGNRRPVCYVYSILTEKRDQLREHLTDAGIGTSIYYPLPLHLQPCFSYLGYEKGALPVAEKTSSMILSLPVFPDLTQEEMEYTAAEVVNFFKNRP